MPIYKDIMFYTKFILLFVRFCRLTRVSVETESSTGLFLFIYLETFKSQNDIN